MSTEEFLASKSANFHLELLKFYYLTANKKEQDKQKDTDILFFDFEEGKYTISFLDLKEKANVEAEELLKRAQPNTLNNVFNV